MTLLIVEDNKNIRLTLQDALEMEGYDVVLAESVTQAKTIVTQQSQINKSPIKGIILDIMLPDGNGYEFARWFRQQCNTTFILMLTARELERDIVEGLDSGADDYMTKPFSNVELLARIRALQRRLGESKVSNSQPISYINHVEINWDLMTATKSAQVLKLSAKALSLLKYLYQHRNTACPRQKILDSVWGESVYVDERTIDNFVSQLKKSLNLVEGQEFYLKTIRGVGYSLICNSSG
jgi:DNA-binding response OmpR family regulator